MPFIHGVLLYMPLRRALFDIAGKNDDIMVGGQHTLEQDGAPPQQSTQETPDKEQSGTESTKKSTTQPGEYYQPLLIRIKLCVVEAVAEHATENPTSFTFTLFLSYQSACCTGVVVAAGLLGAFKAIGGMFKRTKRDEQN